MVSALLSDEESLEFEDHLEAANEAQPSGRDERKHLLGHTPLQKKANAAPFSVPAGASQSRRKQACRPLAGAQRECGQTALSHADIKAFADLCTAERLWDQHRSDGRVFPCAYQTEAQDISAFCLRWDEVRIHAQYGFYCTSTNKRRWFIQGDARHRASLAARHWQRIITQ